MDVEVIILPLLIGWILDLIFGDPIRLPHPVIWFGKAISSCEHNFNKNKNLKFKGAVVSISLILLVFALSSLLIYFLSPYKWLNIIVQSILVFYCLAGKTLIKEVKMTFEAVDKSLARGRQQVARIVGRDTSRLSANEIRTAALETLAENLSDGVVAPLFWFALLGVPGMLAYKMINTLDSMIGYRNARYKDFGCVAARIDDITNFIPARITSFLMLFVSGRLNLISFVCRFGRQHLSPNSGYPEAALAGILQCRFGGPHDYFGESVYKPYIGETQRDFTTNDAIKATAINRKVEIVAVVCCIGIRYLILSLTHIPVWL